MMLQVHALIARISALLLKTTRQILPIAVLVGGACLGLSPAGGAARIHRRDRHIEVTFVVKAASITGTWSVTNVRLLLLAHGNRLLGLDAVDTSNRAVSELTGWKRGQGSVVAWTSSGCRRLAIPTAQTVSSVIADSVGPIPLQGNSMFRRVSTRGEQSVWESKQGPIVVLLTESDNNLSTRRLVTRALPKLNIVQIEHGIHVNFESRIDGGAIQRRLIERCR